MSHETSLGKIYRTGETCSHSGQYAVVDEKGIVTGREYTMVQGNKFPPPKDGQGYILVDPTRHDATDQEQDGLDNTLAGIPDKKAYIKTWLDEKNWPTPKWYDDKQRKQELKSYESYFAHRLRSRYFELEADFRTTLSNKPKQRQWVDVYSGERIFAFLGLARKELEQENPNLLEVSQLLDLVDRYMPWIMPPQVLVGRRYGILSQLKNCASAVDLALPLTEH